MISNIERFTCSKIHKYRKILLNSYRFYHITVEPETCLHDVPVSICATGLKPNENITISVTTKNDNGEGYFSYAYYKADECGCVNVEKQNSLGGLYKGCLPMGLISSLQHTQFDKRYNMLIKRNVEVPMKMNINLMRGFMGREKCATSLHSDYEMYTPHERYYLSKGAQRIPVKEGRIRGVLFLPPGKGPFPGVIDIYGSNGGLKEARAALLASNGIATFALAYFRYDDLPKELDTVDLDYFEEAVQFLQKHDQILPNGLGVIGLSLGYQIALAMAIHMKEVKAVVAINGIPAVTYYPLKYKNILYKAVPADYTKIKYENDIVSSKDIIDDVLNHPESILQLEKFDGNILFLVSKDDQNWDTLKETRRAMDRLRKYNRLNHELVEFDGAGHMLEPPFNQFCDRMFHNIPKSYMYVGGKLKEHTIAEQKAWPKILSFFKCNLLK